MALDVSQRVVRYEGEGKTRKPVYLDEGPASASIAGQIGEGKTSLIDGLPSRELEGAGVVERRYLSEAERAERVVARPIGPTNAERMQASRQRGAVRHVEVITGRKAVPAPSPTEEEPTVAEPRADHAEIIPEPTGDTLGVLADAVLGAIEAWQEKLQADQLADQATIRWAEARRALGASYRALDATPSVDEVLQASADLAELVADEARASVALDGETQVVDEAMLERAREHGLVDRLTKSDPLAFGETQVVAEQPAIGGGPARRPTTKQDLILAAVVRHAGNLKAIAAELHTTQGNVTATLHNAGKKGRLTIAMKDVLPAAFAKYPGV